MGLWGGGGTLVGLIALWQSTGVPEIRRAHLPVNFSLAAPQPAVEDWPWWLGPHQDGFAARSLSPVRWAPGVNIGWQTPLPGSGRGSPIVWDGRVYLTSADEAGGGCRMVCLDRQSGKLLWQTQLQRGRFPQAPSDRLQPDATPACDGERVYVAAHQSGTLNVTALDLTGKIVWQRAAGPASSASTHGSSPVISGSLVIVSADRTGRLAGWSGSGGYLAALHRQSGEIIWRIARPSGDTSGTPIVAKIANRDQLVVPGRKGVTAYDPATGTTLWTCRWTADRPIGSIAYDADCVYASIRRPLEQVLCIRADGAGDVTTSHVRWRERRTTGDRPSPIVCGDDLLILADEGVLTCLDKETGTVRWKKRLGGRFSASPIVMAQYVYCVNEAGVVFVVDRLSRGEIVAENPVGQGCFAPPAISGNSLLFRSAKGVLLVQSPSTAPFAEVPPVERSRF